jgi:hypothetical protein
MRVRLTLNLAPGGRDQRQMSVWVMTEQTPSQKPSTPLALKIALGCWAISLAWWFAYYAQYQGPFDLLTVKFLCINGATAECERFRTAIGPGSIPAYYPLFWCAGLALGLIGSLQIMRDSGVFGRKP